MREHATDRLQIDKNISLLPFLSRINLKCFKLVELQSLRVVPFIQRDRQQVDSKVKGRVMHQLSVRPRAEEEQAGKVEARQREESQREESRLLGLFHGYLLALQTVVGTDG